jgi:hypothetical protein
MQPNPSIERTGSACLHLPLMSNVGYQYDKMVRKRRVTSTLARVRSLWYEWDPIGVFSIDSDWPADEYDSYLGKTLRILESGASTDELVASLEWGAFEYMELTSFRKSS